MSWAAYPPVAPRSWQAWGRVEPLLRLGRYRVFPFEAELRDLETQGS